VRRSKRIAILLCIAALLLPSTGLAVNDGFKSSYTYTYDYWEDVLESPDAYRVDGVIDSMTLGLDNLDGKRINKPDSLFAQGDDLYICDTGNNRIIQISTKDGKNTVKRVISEITGSDNNTFNSPSDVFVDAQENIYIADMNNERIVMVDKNLVFIRQYVKPTDSTFDQSLPFFPKKVVADAAGRVYALCQNVNKGLVKFEADGSFSGFIGANTVSVTTGEYIWRRFFMTKAQRAQTSNFVPTEFANCYIDPEGFIYVTNTVFSEYDLKWDNAKPIRRLNSIGTDILVKNDRYPPIGDLDWSSGGVAYGPSKFEDITVMDNEVYIVIDRTRGRVFGYDNQGILLWAFGGKGNYNGAFGAAISIEHIGYNLYVLDQIENSITVFTPTEYGMLIYDAIDEYGKGEYDKCADIWREVLKLNSNYKLAFRGIGRAVLRQNHFQEAMHYFELAHDRENYGRAFKLYRKEWIEQNVWWVILIVALLLIIPLVVGRVRRTKWEVIMHEHSKIRH